MKSLLSLATLTLFLVSCSHSIVRSGYILPENPSTDCPVSVQYGYAKDIDSSARYLGKIKLDDTGFSTSCSESDALAILRKEACALDANTVLITEFKEPSLMSTCYRCSANFYSIKTATQLADSSQAQSDQPKQPTPPIRSKELYKTPEPNPAAYILGYVAGFAIGYLLVSLLF
jgi:hypothetical protein